ncbi:ectonucleoside triphosphate diphosphohydrolase 8-like [Discoglossus pictus]
MDLGGASTQISFIPKEDIEDPKEKKEFSLYGYPYTIYTHSYLCYGLNEALRKTLVNTITGQDVKKPINAPCYPKGYTNTTSVKSLYVLPCISAPPPSSEQVTLMGTGQFAQCRTLVQSIFNFSACGNRTQCSFDGVYQPPVVGAFYAFSAFHTIFRFLNLTTGQSLMEVNSTIWSFCSREWSELKSSYPGVEPDHLRDCCPSSIYILTLLLDAYKFNATTWSSIRFVKQEDNTDIGWTLGYMLNLTNMIPADHVITLKAHDNNIWGAAITFIIFSLLLRLYMLFNNVKRLCQYGAGQY